MEFAYVLEKSLSFEEAESRFRDAIESVGLKVVGEVMPSEKIKKGLRIDIPPYKILLICHAKYMYDMLQMNYNIAALVPCHGIVYEKDGKVYVGVDFATQKVAPAGEEFVKMLEDAEKKLKEAVDKV